MMTPNYQTVEGCNTRYNAFAKVLMWGTGILVSVLVALVVAGHGEIVQVQEEVQEAEKAEHAHQKANLEQHADFRETMAQQGQAIVGIKEIISRTNKTLDRIEDKLK